MTELEKQQKLNRIKIRIEKLLKELFDSLGKSYDTYKKTIELAKDAGFKVNVDTGEIIE